MFSKPRDRRKHHRKNNGAGNAPKPNTDHGMDDAKNEKTNDNSNPSPKKATKSTPEQKLLGITAPLSLKAPDETELAQTEALREALQPLGVFQSREEMLERVAHLSCLLETIGELVLNRWPSFRAAVFFYHFMNDENHGSRLKSDRHN